MSHMKDYLSDALKKALHQAFDVQDVFVGVKNSDRPDLSDYQTNVAMTLAKSLKKAPQSIANALIDAWPLKDSVDIFSAGPGFLNFKLKNDFLLHWLNDQKTHEKMGFELNGASKKVVVDYGGPNAAKPMHVGHLRSSIIGDSLKRLAIFAGHDAVGDIHLGDWGTQMGMLLVGLKEKYPDWVYFDTDFQGLYPKESPVTLEELEAVYPEISARTKEDETLAELCRKATQELQQGRPGYLALWQHFVDVSVDAMKHSFKRLGVSFELWYGESRYQEALAPLVDLFEKRGLATRCEGAMIVPVAREDDKAEMPPVILQKSDGGYLYATTDLATIQERIQEIKADEAIYVVDGRQRLHFEQVFRAAALMGWTLETHFVGFGTMNGLDGKPFKTRAGGVMKLSDLMDMLDTEALSRVQAQEKAKGLPDAEIQDIAHKIGVGALKFADLQHDPKQNYQFDVAKFMRFEGKTGPYLQYAAVRLKSLLEKAGEAWQKESFQEEMLSEHERDLGVQLIRFPDVVAEALEHYAPNILCEAAFQLAQAFSRFYGQCPVLSLEDGALKTNRLQLCSLTLRLLTHYLELLGIQVPKRM